MLLVLPKYVHLCCFLTSLSFLGTFATTHHPASPNIYLAALLWQNSDLSSDCSLIPGGDSYLYTLDLLLGSAYHA